jgi:hypothetical protein
MGTRHVHVSAGRAAACCRRRRPPDVEGLDQGNHLVADVHRRGELEGLVRVHRARLHHTTKPRRESPARAAFDEMPERERERERGHARSGRRWSTGRGTRRACRGPRGRARTRPPRARRRRRGAPGCGRRVCRHVRLREAPPLPQRVADPKHRRRTRGGGRGGADQREDRAPGEHSDR